MVAKADFFHLRPCWGQRKAYCRCCYFNNIIDFIVHIGNYVFLSRGNCNVHYCYYRTFTNSFTYSNIQHEKFIWIVWWDTIKIKFLCSSFRQFCFPIIFIIAPFILRCKSNKDWFTLIKHSIKSRSGFERNIKIVRDRSGENWD
jgi:hypothetical protein